MIPEISNKQDKYALTDFVAPTKPALDKSSAVLVNNQNIVDIVNYDAIPKDYIKRSLHGNILCPGFFDIQVNGGGDVLFNDNPSVEGISKIADAHRTYGTTQLLPTLISDSMDKIQQAIQAVDEAIEQGVPGVVGIHLEGPFLNADKKGIHDASKFIHLSDKLVPELSKLKRGVTLITLAPERVSTDLIEQLKRAGCVVFAGHTNASYEQCVAAQNAGISGYTHLFNAMSALQSRAPGAVGAALSSDDCYFGLIADGHHVHPSALKVAIKSNPDRAILVTDAMPSVGGKKSQFRLGEHLVQVNQGCCQNSSGTLAGSHLNMQQAVKNIQVQCGMPVPLALNMASLHPANAMGLSASLGKIEAGYSASFTILDHSGSVVSCYIEGVEFPN